MKRIAFFLGTMLLGICIFAMASGEGFTVVYHEGFDKPAAEQTTYVEYGTTTQTTQIQELGFEEIGRVFSGWAVHRDIDDTWRLTNTSDNTGIWMKLGDEGLPAGYVYELYPDGGTVAKTAENGTVDFYAQWREASYSILYYEAEDAEPSGQITQVTYGVSTVTRTIAELGFQTDDRVFAGWKVFREDEETWRLCDSDGNEVWKELENGELPVGYEYALWREATTVSRTVSTGSVRFYATWISTDFAPQKSKTALLL